MKKSVLMLNFAFIMLLSFGCASTNQQNGETVTSSSAGRVYKDVPSAVDPNAKYLFYMHGLGTEKGGDSFNYFRILDRLAERGFNVIGEARSPVVTRKYAEKVAGQVKKLLSAGVPARNITVAGHSKGGMITMIVMAILGNPDIAYVSLAACAKEGSEYEEGYLKVVNHAASLARGQLLSVYDRSDDGFGTCKLAFDKMTNAVVAERELDLGGGHLLFSSPKTEWLDILQAWAERQHQ